LLNLEVFHLVKRAGEDVLVENNEIGQLVCFQRSLLVLFEGQVSEDFSDAQRLSQDPTFRLSSSGW
jgi:hypothetical protein